MTRFQKPERWKPPMENSLSNKIVIVTGSSRGIGRACVEAFLANGSIVVGCDISSEHDISSEQYHHRVVDVSCAEQLHQFVSNTKEEFGNIDVLVNNAGIHPPTRVIDDVSLSEFDHTIATNLRSVFVASRAALPALRQVGGSIVNIASSVGLHGQEGAVAYCASKAGICGLTKALAIDEAPHGVRVNTVCPGAILTPLAKKTHTESERDKISNWSWMNRWGTSEEVAEMVLFLASGKSSYITGQDMIVGGGSDLGYGFKGHHYYRELEDIPK